MHLLSKTERNNYMQIEIIRLFFIHLIFCILSTLKSNFLIFEHKRRFSLLTPLFVLHNKGIARNIPLVALHLRPKILCFSHMMIVLEYFFLFHILQAVYVAFLYVSVQLFRIQSILYSWIPKSNPMVKLEVFL